MFQRITDKASLQKERTVSVLHSKIYSMLNSNDVTAIINEEYSKYIIKHVKNGKLYTKR